MRRCRIPGDLFMVLVLASLLMFSACGLPNYVNLDSPRISITSVQAQLTDPITVTVEMSDAGLAKLTEYQVTGGPSLKLFYVVSTNPNFYSDPITNIPAVNTSDYHLSSILTAFNTNFRGGSSGNGVNWSPQASSAPGFFLYTKNDGSVRNFSRDTRGLVDLETTDDPGGILVGTFSQYVSTTPGTAPDDYVFGGPPTMDIVIPASSTNTYTLNVQQVGVGGPYTLVLQDGSQTIHLASYLKHWFPQSATEADLKEFFEEYPYFHDAVYEEAKTNGVLYIHVLGAIYAGEGDFTNIYWSPLQYLGKFKLF